MAVLWHLFGVWCVCVLLGHFPLIVDGTWSFLGTAGVCLCHPTGSHSLDLSLPGGTFLPPALGLWRCSDWLLTCCAVVRTSLHGWWTVLGFLWILEALVRELCHHGLGHWCSSSPSCWTGFGYSGHPVNIAALLMSFYCRIVLLPSFLQPFWGNYNLCTIQKCLMRTVSMHPLFLLSLVL